MRTVKLVISLTRKTFGSCTTVLAAGIALSITLTGAALAESAPQPRAKPAHAPMKKATSRTRVPLPRRKPSSRATTKQKSVDTQTRNPITARRGGRLEVEFDQLGRERNPDQASNLRPTEKKTKWSRSQIKQARDRCAFVLAATNLDAQPVDPIGGPGGCGIAAPIKISSFGAVRVKPAAKLNCTLAAALYKWLTEEVQPAARKGFKQPIVEIRNLASYQCRSRQGVAGGRISEHAFGNALDIGSFKLASGESVSVLDHWSSTSSFFGINAKAKFLTRAHKGACSTFATVLGPEANKAHKNHFHFDLGRAGRYKICE